jgi:streptomycin 6-kinase
LDIPDQVRMTVIADGNESWLDELPGVVDSLAREWSLMIGSSFAGGHAALVVEVTLADGTPAVLKIGVPGRGTSGGRPWCCAWRTEGDAPGCWAKT